MSRVLLGDDWCAWRELRLRALADSPSAFGSTLERERALTEAAWRARLDDVDDVCLVADRDGVSVGMGAGYRDLPGLLHVVAMWVEPAFRGQGVAHELLRDLDAWAAARGLGLHLDVNTANVAARRSYASYGFVATGETRALREGSQEVVERMLLRDGRPATTSSTHAAAQPRTFSPAQPLMHSAAQPPTHSAESPPE